jgi:hypothetical protein
MRKMGTGDERNCDMKKLLPVLAIVGLVGCISMPKLNVGAGLSGVMPESESLDGTYQGDVFVRIDVAMLQVEASLGMREYVYTDSGTDEYDLTVMPLAVVVKYGIGPSAAKLLIGAGMVWNINDVSEAASTVDIDDALGYRLSVGGYLMLPLEFGLTAEVMYDFTEADLEGAITNGVDMNALMVRVALSYQF